MTKLEYFIKVLEQLEDAGGGLSYNGDSLQAGRYDYETTNFAIMDYFKEIGEFHYFTGEISAPYAGCFWELISGIIDKEGKVHFAYNIDITRHSDQSPAMIMLHLDELEIVRLADAKEKDEDGRTYIQSHQQPACTADFLKLLVYLSEEFEDLELPLDCCFCRCGSDLGDDDRYDTLTYLHSEMQGNGGIGVFLGDPICEDCYHGHHCSYCGSEISQPGEDDPWNGQFYDEETGTEWCEVCVDEHSKSITDPESVPEDTSVKDTHTMDMFEGEDSYA